MEYPDTEFEYKKALIAAREHIKRLHNENHALKSLQEDLKQHNEKLKTDLLDREKKLLEAISERRATEETYEVNIKRYNGLLAQRDKTIEDLQTRSLAIGDPELLRLRIQRDMEEQYKGKIELIGEENEKVRKELAVLKQTEAALRVELESSNKEHQRMMIVMKENYVMQINDMTEQLKALQKPDDNEPYRSQLQTLRRELMESQQALIEMQRELSELKRERDRFKQERDQFSFEKAKLTGNEELLKTNHQYELEKVNGKIKDLQEDLANETTKGLERNHKIEQLIFELEALKKKYNEEQLEYSSSVRRVTELEELLKDREAEINTYIRKTKQEEKQTYLLEMEERGKLQNEIDRLDAGLLQVSEQAKNDKEELLRQIQSLETIKRSSQDELKELRRKVMKMQADNEALKETYIKSMDKKDEVEKELKKLQEKHRNLLSTEQAHMNVRDKLELTVKKYNDTVVGLEEEKVGWAKERKDLQAQIMTLTQRLEKTTKEAIDNINHYKSKAREYKAKTRQANLKLNQIAGKFARAQAENLSLPGNATISPEVKGSEFSELVPELRQIESEIARTLNAHKQIAGKLGL